MPRLPAGPGRPRCVGPPGCAGGRGRGRLPGRPAAADGVGAVPSVLGAAVTELRPLPGAVAAQAAPAEAPPSTQVSHDDVRPGLELARLIADATRADGHAPFGEHVLLTLDNQPRVNHARIVSRVGCLLAGYLALPDTPDGAWYAELVTAPAYRSRGVAAPACCPRPGATLPATAAAACGPGCTRTGRPTRSPTSSGWTSAGRCATSSGR